jgi:hypothetical protein
MFKLPKHTEISLTIITWLITPFLWATWLITKPFGKNTIHSLVVGILLFMFVLMFFGR